MPSTKSAQKQQIEDYFLNGALLVTFILVFLVFRPYISILFLAFVLAVIFHPVFLWTLKRTGNREVLAAILSTLTIIIIVLIPLAIFSSLVISEFASAISSPNNFLVHLSNFQVPEVVQRLNVDFKSYFQNLLGGFVNDIGTIFSNLASLFIFIIMTIITLVYFFKDGLRMRRALFRTLPFTREQREKLSTDLAAGVRAVIGGYILIAIIQGIVSGIGYWIFGIPNPALWGFVAFICAMLPTFGSSLINIPVVIFLFVNHHTGNSIGFAIWYLVSLGIIDNFIGPKFISGRINIHPLLIIFSLIGGLNLFGAVGFIIGPLIVILFWSILEMFKLREEQEEQSAKEA